MTVLTLVFEKHHSDKLNPSSRKSLSNHSINIRYLLNRKSGRWFLTMNTEIDLLLLTIAPFLLLEPVASFQNIYYLKFLLYISFNKTHFSLQKKRKLGQLVRSDHIEQDAQKGRHKRRINDDTALMLSLLSAVSSLIILFSSPFCAACSIWSFFTRAQHGFHKISFTEKLHTIMHTITSSRVNLLTFFQRIL